MDAVARVRIGGIESLIDDERKLCLIGASRGLAQCPVVFDPLRGLQPAEDVFPVAAGRVTVDRLRAQLELRTDEFRFQSVKRAASHGLA